MQRPSMLDKQASSGRLPWFNTKGEPFQPYIIGISGGSGSGKTSITKKIISSLNVPWVIHISMDNFYNTLTPEQHLSATKNEHNFDHPSCFDYSLLYTTLQKLKSGFKVSIPIYDFVTHSRLQDQSIEVYGANVIVFEGLFALWDDRVRDCLDLRVFVDTDSDIRLARRLVRDIAERGRDLQGVLSQYLKFVKPAYDAYIHPTMKHADVIIPRGLDNHCAVDLITKHVFHQLNEYGLFVFRDSLVLMNEKDGKGKPSNLIMVEQSAQNKGIHTIIRDKGCSIDDFIFYTHRIARIVIERSLDELPYKSITVETTTGKQVQGNMLDSEGLCAVSIVRAGEIMEKSLRNILPQIPLGKLLIQTCPTTGEPTLHFISLPSKMKYVLLCDATIATGASAIMAIRVLIEHGVPEERVVFLTIIATKTGLKTIERAFPAVRVVVSEIDEGLDAKWFIVPGVGNFGNRYFGT